jgi:hypothetical protein
MAVPILESQFPVETRSDHWCADIGERLIGGHSALDSFGRW